MCVLINKKWILINVAGKNKFWFDLISLPNVKKADVVLGFEIVSVYK